MQCIIRNFINVENRGGLWKDSADVFEVLVIVEKYFRCNVSKQKRKIDVKKRKIRGSDRFKFT